MNKPTISDNLKQSILSDPHIKKYRIVEKSEKYEIGKFYKIEYDYDFVDRDGKVKPNSTPQILVLNEWQNKIHAIKLDDMDAKDKLTLRNLIIHDFITKLSEKGYTLDSNTRKNMQTIHMKDPKEFYERVLKPNIKLRSGKDSWYRTYNINNIVGPKVEISFVDVFNLDDLKGKSKLGDKNNKKSISDFKDKDGKIVINNDDDWNRLTDLLLYNKKDPDQRAGWEAIRDYNKKEGQARFDQKDWKKK